MNKSQAASTLRSIADQLEDEERQATVAVYEPLFDAFFELYNVVNARREIRNKSPQVDMAAIRVYYEICRSKGSVTWSFEEHLRDHTDFYQTHADWFPHQGKEKKA